MSKDRGALIELKQPEGRQYVDLAFAMENPLLTASNPASPYFGEYNDYVFPDVCWVCPMVK